MGQILEDIKNYINVYNQISYSGDSSFEPTSLENLLCLIHRNLKIDLADRIALEKFVFWLKTKPKWHILIEKETYNEIKYKNRDFKFFPVYNRFDKPYIKRVLKKFETIELLAEDAPFVHMILTVPRTRSIRENEKLLKKGWNHLANYLAYKKGLRYPFFTTMEPQRDGYPHLHILYFCPKYVIDQEELSKYCKECGIGEITFIKRYWPRGHRKKPIQYLRKYLSKQYKKERWDFKDLLFYACLWFENIRSYSFSRIFSIKVIKKQGWKLVVVGTKEMVIKIVLRNIEMGYYALDSPLENFLSGPETKEWLEKDNLRKKEEREKIIKYITEKPFIRRCKLRF